jgi:YbbR domain-containing protein
MNFKKYINNIWAKLGGSKDKSNSSRLDRKTIIIFVICILLAFSLWLVVNLNRNYNINLQVPLALNNVNTKKALAEKLPNNVMATINGRGWLLIKLYNHPPTVNINVTGEQVNMLQQVRRQIDNQNVTVQKVSPFYLQPKLVTKQTKKVPVKPNVDVQFGKQYGFLQQPMITPDSVTISGGHSQIENIHQWPTDSLSRTNVQKNLSLSLSLKKPDPLVKVSPHKVSYQAKVVKLTNDEVTVPITKLNFPADHMITFIPSSVTIRYKIPLEEYDKVGSIIPFKAIITYQQLKHDSTGFLTPQIKQTVRNVHLEVRSIQPSEINYFTVIGDRDNKKISF